MKYLLFLIILIFGTSLNAQNTFSKKIDLDSIALRNYVNDLKTIDNNVILTSSSLCALGTSDVACLSLSKFSIKGNLEKSIVLDSFNSFASGKEGLEVKGEKIIISTHQKDDYFKFTSVLNYDHNLNNKKFVKYDQSPSSSKIGNQGVALVDNSFYTYGIISNSYDSPDSIQIIKIDDAGNEIWRKYYTNDNASLKVNGLQGTPDGNLAFILELSGPPGNNDYFDGYHIMKIDTSGTVLDSFIIEEDNKQSNRLLVASDGSYYFGINSHPVNDIPFYGASGTINKLNDDMNSLEWSFDMPNNQLVDGRYFEFYDFLEAKNGDIIVCGTVFDNTDTELATGVPGRNSTWNGFIIRLTPDGEMKWLRLYKHNNDLLPHDEYGKFRPSKLDKIKELPDGRLVGAGNVYVNNRQYSGINEAETEGFHLWLLMVDENGCLDGEECEEIIRIDGENNFSEKYLSIIKSGQTWINRNPIIAPFYSYQYYYSQDSVFFDGQYYFERIESLNEDGSDEFGTSYFNEVDGRLMQILGDDVKGNIILDMNMSVGDTIEIYQNYGPMTLYATNVDTVIYDDMIPRKRIELKCLTEAVEGDTKVWVEGIGELQSGIDCTIDGLYQYINCVVDSTGSRIYKNASVDECWITTSTDDLGEEDFSVFPNPTGRFLNISGIDHFDGMMSITDTKGRVMKRESITFHNSYEVDLNGFVGGTYLIRLISDDGVYEAQRVLLVK